MRMLLEVTLPNEPFNTMVKNGTVAAKLQQVMAEVRPEVAFFTTIDGERGAVMVIDVQDWSELPARGEPLFLAFNAKLRIGPAMTAEELGKADLVAIGKKFA